MNVSEGNITTGQLLSRLIKADKLTAGTVGYLYGVVEPHLADSYVTITGWRRNSHGGYDVTLLDAAGRAFTAAPEAKLAAYVDQEDAARAFKELQKEYRRLVNNGDHNGARRVRRRPGADLS